MKTNIVIFEMNPEVLDVFRVPETAVSAEVLNALAGLYFNCDDVTDEDWSNFDVVNVAVAQDYCWMWTNKTTAATKLSVTLRRK